VRVATMARRIPHWTPPQVDNESLCPRAPLGWFQTYNTSSCRFSNLAFSPETTVSSEEHQRWTDPSDPEGMPLKIGNDTCLPRIDMPPMNRLYGVTICETTLSKHEY